MVYLIWKFFLKLFVWSEIHRGLLMNIREVDTSLGILHIQEDGEGLG